MQGAAGGNDRDDGYSLIELLAAVALLGIAVVAILSALAVLVRASAEHREMANTNVVLENAAEYVKAAPFSTCETADYGTVAAGALTNGVVPADWSESAVTVAVTGCTGDSTYQDVTIAVTTPDGWTDSIVVGKAAASTIDPTNPPTGSAGPCVLALQGGATWEVTAGDTATLRVHAEPHSCGDGPIVLWLFMPGNSNLIPLIQLDASHIQPQWVTPIPISTGACSSVCEVTGVVYDSYSESTFTFPITISAP